MSVSSEPAMNADSRAERGSRHFRDPEPTVHKVCVRPVRTTGAITPASGIGSAEAFPLPRQGPEPQGSAGRRCPLCTGGARVVVALSQCSSQLEPAAFAAPVGPYTRHLFPRVNRDQAPYSSARDPATHGGGAGHPMTAVSQWPVRSCPVALDETARAGRGSAVRGTSSIIHASCGTRRRDFRRRSKAGEQVCGPAARGLGNAGDFCESHAYQGLARTAEDVGAVYGDIAFSSAGRRDQDVADASAELVCRVVHGRLDQVIAPSDVRRACRVHHGAVLLHGKEEAAAVQPESGVHRDAKSDRGRAACRRSYTGRASMKGSLHRRLGWHWRRIVATVHRPGRAAAPPRPASTRRRPSCQRTRARIWS